jgi:hypothetical protein
MQRRNGRTIDNLFQHDHMINDQMMPAPSPCPSGHPKYPAPEHPVFIRTVTKMHIYVSLLRELCPAPPQATVRLYQHRVTSNNV